VGRTFKDQRDWERKQSGNPRRAMLDEEYSRKNRHIKFDDVMLEDLLDEDDYSEYDLDYYE